MVVDNPISEDERDSLIAALEETLDGDATIKSASTAEGTFDYAMKVSQMGNRRMRNVDCKAKWHEDADDWEISIDSTGRWRS